MSYDATGKRKFALWLLRYSMYIEANVGFCAICILQSKYYHCSGNVFSGYDRILELIDIFLARTFVKLIFYPEAMMTFLAKWRKM